MFIQRNFSLKRIWKFSAKETLFFTFWSALIVIVYEVAHLEWLRIPWLPLSVIGTAVAFYLGFQKQ